MGYAQMTTIAILSAFAALLMWMGYRVGSAAGSIKYANRRTQQEVAGSDLAQKYAQNETASDDAILARLKNGSF